MEKITLGYVLERIKERHGLKSDYQVCKLIETSTALMSGWRSGKSLPDEKYCQRLAEAAGIDPLVLAASMQAQRSKTDEARSLWEMVAERLQMVPQALAIAVFSALFATGFVATDAHAQGAQQVAAANFANDSSIHRIYQKGSSNCSVMTVIPAPSLLKTSAPCTEASAWICLLASSFCMCQPGLYIAGTRHLNVQTAALAHSYEAVGAL